MRGTASEVNSRSVLRNGGKFVPGLRADPSRAAEDGEEVWRRGYDQPSGTYICWVLVPISAYATPGYWYVYLLTRLLGTGTYTCLRDYWVQVPIFAYATTGY